MTTHLGGHVNRTNLEIGCINYLINKYKIRSFIDIGCGTGGMVELLHSKNIISKGLEGDIKAIKKSKVSNLITQIDFSKEEYKSKDIYDLGYSVEFLEHVDEKYIKNYIGAFKNCKYFVMTCAPPKWPGHHHVNCQNHIYWIKLFNENGFYHYPYETLKCRKNCTMNLQHRCGSSKTFTKHRLLFFINANLINIDNYNINTSLSENITENELIVNNIYKEKHYPENDTNKVTNTNGYLFKSTIPLISKIN